MCRNLPYLKRDCDALSSAKPSAKYSDASKPALLKKGLRPLNLFSYFLQLQGRNLPYLKRDCDEGYGFYLFKEEGKSKPALLKKGLRLFLRGGLGPRAESKPALLKKGLRPALQQFHKNSDICVETCPT